MPTYEDARTVCAAASDEEFLLPNYDGGPGDYNYLKSYVLGLVTDIYGVPADIFSTATIFSTSLLRDFVHRAIYQSTTHEYIDDIAARGGLLVPQTEDVATALRYPAWGLCGLLAWQEFQVFRAFGYDTNLLAFINNDIGAFTDSHTTTEVFCEDLNRYIVQDATFNFVFEDASGNALTWNEARTVANDGGDLIFDSFEIYTYYRSSGQHMTAVSPELQSLFENDYLRAPILWADDGAAPGADGNLYRLFPNWQVAHDPGSYQGGTYASSAQFWADISALTETLVPWNRLGNILGNNHYISGFRINDGGEWLTGRLQDGSYVSFEIHSGQMLVGSYDQLMTDATGDARNLNPGTDLEFMLGHADVMAWDGTVMHRWADAPQASPQIIPIRSTATGELRLWNILESPQAAIGFGTPDKTFTLQDRGDYDGDGLIDFLFVKPVTGEVGYWNEHRTWSRLDKVSSAWQPQSHAGTSDLWGDGQDDILWMNSSTGQVVAWNMFEGAKSGYQSYGIVNPAWRVAAIADLNGDTTDDILWTHSITGEVRKWIMRDGLIQQNSRIDQVGVNWEVIGTGDFRDDRSYDVVWRNRGNGEIVLWDMDEGARSSVSTLDFLAPHWDLAAAVDITPGGPDDMLWRNTLNGEIYYWEMDNGRKTIPNGVLGTDWDIV